MAGHTVVVVLEKIVSVVVVILLSCFDLFAGDVLLQVSNQNQAHYLALWCDLCTFFFFLKRYLYKLTGSSLASLLTMLSR